MTLPFESPITVDLEWWHPLAIIVGLIALVNVLQIIGVINDPLRLSVKVTRVSISSNYLRRPFRRLIFKTRTNPLSVFRFSEYKEFSTRDGRLTVWMENGTAYSVRGTFTVTMEVWGVPSYSNQSVRLDTITWTTPYDALYMPYKEFLICTDVSVPAFVDHTMLRVTNISGEIRWA